MVRVLVAGQRCAMNIRSLFANNEARTHPYRAAVRQIFTILVVVAACFALRGAVTLSRAAPPLTPVLAQ